MVPTRERQNPNGQHPFPFPARQKQIKNQTSSPIEKTHSRPPWTSRSIHHHSFHFHPAITPKKKNSRPRKGVGKIHPRTELSVLPTKPRATPPWSLARDYLPGFVFEGFPGTFRSHLPKPGVILSEREITKPGLKVRTLFPADHSMSRFSSVETPRVWQPGREPPFRTGTNNVRPQPLLTLPRVKRFLYGSPKHQMNDPVLQCATQAMSINPFGE